MHLVKKNGPVKAKFKKMFLDLKPKIYFTAATLLSLSKVCKVAIEKLNDFKIMDT